MVESVSSWSPQLVDSAKYDRLDYFVKLQWNLGGDNKLSGPQIEILMHSFSAALKLIFSYFDTSLVTISPVDALYDTNYKKLQAYLYSPSAGGKFSFL